jgi:hypothetical protein
MTAPGSTDTHSVSARTRMNARAVLVAVVSVVGVVPVVLERDSFPLSDFPMFSSRRSTVESVDTAVAVSADGARQHRLTPSLMSGSDEPVTAAVTVSRAINEGAAQTLCSDIAARLSRSAPSWLDEGSAIEVVTERHDALKYFAGDRSPVDRVVHVRCAVQRP